VLSSLEGGDQERKENNSNEMMADRERVAAAIWGSSSEGMQQERERTVSLPDPDNDVELQRALLRALDEQQFDYNSNFTPREETLAATPAPVPRAYQHFEIGDKVVMQGLKNAAFNGKTGAVRSTVEEGRVKVVLDEDKKKGIKVKVENLKLSEEGTEATMQPSAFTTATATARQAPLFAAGLSSEVGADLNAEDDLLNAAIAMSMRDSSVEEESRKQAALVGGTSEEELIEAAIKASMDTESGTT